MTRIPLILTDSHLSPTFPKRHVLLPNPSVILNHQNGKKGPLVTICTTSRNGFSLRIIRINKMPRGLKLVSPLPAQRKLTCKAVKPHIKKGSHRFPGMSFQVRGSF